MPRSRKQFGFTDGRSARVTRASDGSAVLSMPTSIQMSADEWRRFAAWIGRVVDWIDDPTLKSIA
jgi:hypothetical protein